MNYTQYFDYKKRDNGTSFYCLNDNAPDRLRDFIREVHQGDEFDCLPNDWIYEVIHNAFEEIIDTDLVQFSVEADCYRSELKKWALEPFSDYFIDHALYNYGGIVKEYSELLGFAQADAKETIYNRVLEFLREQKEGEENE